MKIRAKTPEFVMVLFWGIIRLANFLDWDHNIAYPMSWRGGVTFHVQRKKNINPYIKNHPQLTICWDSASGFPRFVLATLNLDL